MKNFSEDNAIEIKYIHKDLYALKESITTNQNFLQSLITRIESLEKQDTNSGGINDSFGKKYYNVEDISRLMDDYSKESFFGNSSTAKWPVCLINANGPSVDVFFRYNILPTASSPHIKLWLWLSNLPSNITQIPCDITLNGKLLSSLNLEVLSNSDHQCFLEFDLPTNTITHKVFNILNIHLNSNALAETFWDWIKVEISNCINPIVLNRNTEYEVYGFGKPDGKTRLTTNKYLNNGTFEWIGYENPGLTNAHIGTRPFGISKIAESPLRWATNYAQQYLKETFKYATMEHFYFFITQNNRFYPYYTRETLSSLDTTTNYIENVLYAKKSLHNGKDKDHDAVCLLHNDFSLSVLNISYGYYVKTENYFTPHNFLFKNQEYPREFIDFIPIYDSSILANKTERVSCGYFLHHKSGNILFVPELNSKYFIKIGKGRQVHAFLSQDNLTISVYYQIGTSVIKKNLTRATEYEEWEMSDTIEEYPNVEAIWPLPNFYYSFKDRLFTKVLY